MELWFCTQYYSKLLGGVKPGSVFGQVILCLFLLKWICTTGFWMRTYCDRDVPKYSKRCPVCIFWNCVALVKIYFYLEWGVWVLFPHHLHRNCSMRPYPRMLWSRGMITGCKHFFGRHMGRGLLFKEIIGKYGIHPLNKNLYWNVWIVTALAQSLQNVLHCLLT